ncbi:MAG: sulfatase [Planctomycetota bacterium]
MKYGLYGGLTAGLAPSLWLSGCRNRPSGKKPNIILIAVDTLRADHLSCSGYSRNTSPNINRFAEDSLLFENCLSNASETWSSFASLLSGFLPHETKAINTRNLPKAVPTLPKTLQRIGYKTVGVVSNYILRRKWGWDEGFTIFDDTLNERELVRKLPERIAEYATNRAIELLEQYHNEQLFMWIHYQDPHGPYTPPERFAKLFTNPNQEPRNLNLKKSLGGRGGIPSYQQLGANRDFHYYVSQYDGEIRYFDEQFHQLIDSLKNFGLYDDSLIIFTSDHGEEMGEHDFFFVHGNSLYNSLTHVPLIIKYGKELTGRRADYVQHIDIVPTILKMIGLKKDRRFRGSDLRRQDTTKKEIFAEVDEWGVLGGKKQLFDLKTDPHEERNLIYDYNYRKQLNDLKVRLERIRDEDFLNIRIPKKPQKLTEEEIEKLKSLGYAH